MRLRYTDYFYIVWGFIAFVLLLFVGQLTWLIVTGRLH